MQIQKKDCCVLIPVYNEGSVLADVIRDIHEHHFSHCLVVNDGSTDNSEAKARQAGAMVITHRIRRGKGAAIRTGLEAIKLLHYKVVITMDGDGQHVASDIDMLLSSLSRGYDVVLGSRFLGKNKIPLLRRFYNWIGNRLIHLLTGISLSDSQSGFRAYSRNAFQQMETYSDAYEYDSEIVQEIKKHRLSYKEVPVKVRYTPYSLQKQQKQSLLNGVKTMMQLLFSSL